MKISKEFQEWLDANYPYIYQKEVPEQVYAILQAKPSWLFPDIGSAEEVFDKYHAEYGVRIWLKPDIIKYAEQYAAQELAKWHGKLVIPFDTQEMMNDYHRCKEENGQMLINCANWKKEVESLKQRVKELENIINTYED